MDKVTFESWMNPVLLLRGCIQKKKKKKESSCVRQVVFSRSLMMNMPDPGDELWFAANTPNKKAVARKSSATGWSSGRNQLHHSPVQNESPGASWTRRCSCVCVWCRRSTHTHWTYGAHENRRNALKSAVTKEIKVAAMVGRIHHFNTSVWSARSDAFTL